MKQIRDPKTILKLGYAALIVAFLSRWWLRPIAHLGEEWIDGIMGLLYGVAIGALLLGVWRQGRQRCGPE